MICAIIFVCVLTAFPLLADVMMKSADFIRILSFQWHCINRKRELRSCRNLKVWAGGYFFIHKGTSIALLELIAYYTMSSIISVWNVVCTLISGAFFKFPILLCRKLNSVIPYLNFLATYNLNSAPFQTHLCIYSAQFLVICNMNKKNTFPMSLCKSYKIIK